MNNDVSDIIINIYSMITIYLLTNNQQVIHIFISQQVIEVSSKQVNYHLEKKIP